MIRNWKEIKSNVDIKTALDAFYNKIYQEQKYEDIAIKNTDTGKFLSSDNVNLNILKVQFTTFEITNDHWSILIPNNDEEQKNFKIRQLVKSSNWSGLKWDKIDCMTVNELFDHCMKNMSDEQKYKIMKEFFENRWFMKSK